MAKLVDERKSPPYVLIIFVFLFLVAAAVAALLYNKLEDAKKLVKQERETIMQLAGDRDDQGRYEYLRDGPIAEMIKQRGNDPLDRPVIAVLVDREKQMRELITAKAGNTEQAKKIVTDLRKDLPKEYESSKLDFTIRTQQQQIATLNKKITTLEGAVTQAEATRMGAENLAKAKSGDLETEKKAHATQITQRDQAVTAHRQKFEAGVESATKDFARLRAGLDKRVSDLSVTQTAMENDNKNKSRKIKALEEKTGPKRKRPRAANLALQPDGKILRVARGENICYIDIGSSSRVRPGVTFSVYSPTGGPHTGELPKTTITVIDVIGKGLSVCRIEKPDPALGILAPGSKKMVVMANDNIANVAFDATRKYIFVVIGQFQLFGMGRPSPALASDPGAAQIAMMVKKFGGTVAKTVSAQTDFIVAGAEPGMPGQLQPDATDQEKAIHALRLTVNAQFKKVSQDAARMQIPVLNDKRFLSLVGYSGRKTLR